MKRHKPLFSRTQLNVLILVLTAVIALLSFTVPRLPEMTFGEQTLAGVRLVWPQPALPGDRRIELLVRLPDWLDSRSPARRLLDAGLRSLLEDHGAVLIPEVRWLRVVLPDEPDKLRALFTAIGGVGEEEQTALCRRVRAQEAVSRRAPLLWDLPALEAVPDLRRLFSRARLLLLASVPPDDELTQVISEALGALPAGARWPERRAGSAVPVRILPGAADPALDAWRPALLWLQPFARRAGLSIRLEPGARESRFALLAADGAPAGADQLKALRRAAEAGSTVLTQKQSEWQRRLAEDLGEPGPGLRLLGRVALYNRPAGDLGRYAQQLAALDAAGLNRQLAALLDPNLYQFVRPAGGENHEATSPCGRI